MSDIESSIKSLLTNTKLEYKNVCKGIRAIAISLNKSMEIKG